MLFYPHHSRLDKNLSTEENVEFVCLIENHYLQRLIDKRDNNLIKVITGLRRSGKSFLLNTIFYHHLKDEAKIDEDHIIKFAFDDEKRIAIPSRRSSLFMSNSNGYAPFKTAMAEQEG